MIITLFTVSRCCLLREYLDLFLNDYIPTPKYGHWNTLLKNSVSNMCHYPWRISFHLSKVSLFCSWEPELIQWNCSDIHVNKSPPYMTKACWTQVSFVFSSKSNSMYILGESLGSQDDFLVFPVPNCQHIVWCTAYWCKLVTLRVEIKMCICFFCSFSKDAV